MKPETVHNVVGALAALYTEMVGELVTRVARLEQAVREKDEVIKAMGAQLREQASSSAREASLSRLRDAVEAWVMWQLGTDSAPLVPAERAILDALEETNADGAGETDLPAALRAARDGDARPAEMGQGQRPRSAADQPSMRGVQGDGGGDVRDGAGPGGDQPVGPAAHPPRPAPGPEGQEPAGEEAEDDRAAIETLEGGRR